MTKSPSTQESSSMVHTQLQMWSHCNGCQEKTLFWYLDQKTDTQKSSLFQQWQISEVDNQKTKHLIRSFTKDCIMCNSLKKLLVSWFRTTKISKLSLNQLKWPPKWVHTNSKMVRRHRTSKNYTSVVYTTTVQHRRVVLNSTTPMLISTISAKPTPTQMVTSSLTLYHKIILLALAISFYNLNHKSSPALVRVLTTWDCIKSMLRWTNSKKYSSSILKLTTKWKPRSRQLCCLYQSLKATIPLIGMYCTYTTWRMLSM